jgi:uncharacterized protein
MKPHYIDVTKILDHPGEEMIFSGLVELEPTKLGTESIDFSLPSNVDVVLRSVTDGVLITGTVYGRLTVRCSRCLERFEYERTVEIAEQAVVESTEPNKDDLFLIRDGKIDLAAIVYQNLIVEVPIRPLCRESCAGLCAICGKNLNEEPHSHPDEVGDQRLAALKEYFKKEKES